MRIDAYNQVNQLQSVSKTKKSVNQAAAKTKSSKDQVSFSTFGRDLQIAKSALKNVPDVREDKVSALKEQMEAGSYKLSGDSFAEKIMSDYGKSII